MDNLGKQSRPPWSVAEPEMVLFVGGGGWLDFESSRRLDGD
jgi:hypothetical protein